MKTSFKIMWCQVRVVLLCVNFTILFCGAKAFSTPLEYPTGIAPTESAWPNLVKFMNTRCQPYPVGDGVGGLPTGITPQAFITAGSNYNVNPAVLVAIAYQESSWGRAQTKIPYNLLGWTGQRTPDQEWNSWDDALTNDVPQIYDQYVREGGIHYSRSLEEMANNYPQASDRADWLKNVTIVFNQTIPEPGTVTLLGLGSLALVRQRRTS